MSIMPPDPDRKPDPPEEMKPGDIVLVDLEHESMIGTALIVGAVHVYVADGNGSSDWYSRKAVSAYVEPDDPEEFCPDCFAGMESSEHHEKCVAALEDEEIDCGHHSWTGLMRLLDEHWPDDIFPTRFEDDPKRDAGARIVSLMRWVDRLRGDAR